MDNMITPNEYFDDIYCLNLKRRAVKWQNVKSKFIREQISVKRIYGIDGSDATVRAVYEHKEKNNQCQHIYSPSGYAILESFLVILNDILDSNAQKVLIFEDDVLFHKNFRELFRKQVSALPKDWNIWYLGGTQQTLPEQYNKNSINPNFYHPQRMDGCFAIAIDRTIIPKLIKTATDYEYPLDSLIKNKLESETHGIISSDPFLCAHDYSISDNLDIDRTHKNKENYDYH